MTAAGRFAALVNDFGDRPGVTPPTGGARFGGSALKVDGAIFAMLYRDQLVVRLPAERVSDLIAAGAGTAFDNGRGSPMRQWLVVSGDENWSSFAEEAFAATATTTATTTAKGIDVDRP